MPRHQRRHNPNTTTSTAETSSTTTPSIYHANLAQLKGYFGRHVSEDALLAVLQMCDNNFVQAKMFLEADGSDTNAMDMTRYDPGKPEEESLPMGYLDRPANFLAEEEMSASTTSVEPASLPFDDAVAELCTLMTRSEPSTFMDHYNAIAADARRYCAVLSLLLRARADVKEHAKPRALAALWSHGHHTMAEQFLMQWPQVFSPIQVLRAMHLLDANRKARALEKKLEKLKHKCLQRTNGVHTLRKSTVKRFETAIADLKMEPVIGTLSGALCRRLRKYFMSLRKADLVFYALQLPREPWKEIADLTHINPLMGLSVPWFLTYAFTENAPSGSAVSDALAVASSEQLAAAVSKHLLPYAFVRKHSVFVTDAIRALIAQTAPLDVLLWYYEELHCQDVAPIVIARLRDAAAQQEDHVDALRLGYGKLVERLLAFRADGHVELVQALLPLADRALMLQQHCDKETVATTPAALEEDRPLALLDTPLVCLGDASYSMDVALRVATIIASLITAMSGAASTESDAADLLFFGETAMAAEPRVPRTLADVLRVLDAVKCHGQTAPAAALLPYLRDKKHVHTFVLVTDEGENMREPTENAFFAQLFHKYRQEVNKDARIVLVSFAPVPARGQTIKGRMHRALLAMGIPPTAEIRLDPIRPDLTKLDGLIGSLTVRSSKFSEKVRHVMDLLAVNSTEWTRVDGA